MYSLMGIPVSTMGYHQEIVTALTQWFAKRQSSMLPHQQGLILDEFDTLRLLLVMEEGHLVLVAEHLQDWDLLGKSRWQIVALPDYIMPLVKFHVDRFVNDFLASPYYRSQRQDSQPSNATADTLTGYAYPLPGGDTKCAEQ
ncbi:MAG TPA: hypothetical protein GXX39_02290 [Syntrophothermus lipocalidus]|nr:hypothetical protein [Syntrophothermus lipocalidus]